MAREREREALKSVYRHSKAWAEKINRWDDDQVVAVYLRLRNQKKL